MSGLVGSRVQELLSSRYEFENISRSTGVDITNVSQVLESIKNTDAKIVLHMAAKTDVDGCEREKDLGEDSDAWKINVIGTKNIAKACFDTGKKIIYISTDFVFDGEIGENEFYNESSAPNPLNFYAKTKYHEGNKHIDEFDSDVCIKCIKTYDPLGKDTPCVSDCTADVHRIDIVGGLRMHGMSLENCVQCRTCEIVCPEVNLRVKPAAEGSGPDFIGL